MVTITTLAVPCEEFALAGARAAVPDARFRCESVVETGTQTVMPLVWARAPDFDRLDDALRDDPTVTDATVLTDLEGQRLYRIDWASSVRLLVGMIVNSEAVVLDAATDDDHWILRVLHASREDAHHMLEFCESRELSVDVRSVREMDADRSTRYGLTDDQYRTLRLARASGYFSVPRDASLEDLADELGVSHQAVSERLRRGIDALLANTIAAGPLGPADGTTSPDDAASASSKSPS